MNKKYYIYKLFFEEEPKTVYIGQTNNVERRFLEHTHYYNLAKNSRKNNWIRDRQSRGWELQCEVIDSTYDSGLIDFMEIMWIKVYRDKGYELKNTTEGGMGHRGIVRSEETRAKLSQSLKGKPKSERAKQNMSSSAKNRPSNRTGKTFTPEQRERLSKTMKARENHSGHLSKRYKITTPSGEVMEILNLAKFARENNLNRAHLSGRGKSKGYTAELIG